MLEKLAFHYPIFDRQFDFNTEELSPLELIGRVAAMVNTIIDTLNNWQDNVNLRELSSDITNKRMLSPTGNFTGSVAGMMASLLVEKLVDNIGKISYITNQFSDGQTGLVIDGGFFEASGIDKNYDGGIF